ncbi:MAG: rod shape-determining protein MreC [Peptococcaceae bacterium]|nr:rod shape-determining protein MreC [Peptococcaceae bacterium]
MRKRANVTGITILVFFLLLAILISMRLTGLDRSFPNPVGNVLQRVAAPVEYVILSAGRSVSDHWKMLWRIPRIETENETLQLQMDELMAENLRLKSQILAGLRYNELDQAQFRAPTADKYEQIGASIVNRNPSAWFQTLILNRGSRDGVAVEDPVVAHSGLVGKVISVSGGTCEVLMILDSEGQVSALVRESAGEGVFGIVQGTYDRSSRLTAEGNLQMTFRREDPVNRGDLVYTSGIGGVYPKDIPIGKVVEIKLDRSGLMKTAYIEPIVHFDSLEEVYIIKTVGGE